MPEWRDLIDPTADKLKEALPGEIHGRHSRRCSRRTSTTTSRGRASSRTATTCSAILLLPIEVTDEKRLYYQEIDFVATPDVLVTVSKTPPGEKPFDPAPAKEACRAHEGVGMYVYHLLDEVAESFLDVIDALDDEIDDLEDAVPSYHADGGRPPHPRLRHGLLGIRRTLGPTRDAVRKIVDNRVELDEGELFPRDAEIALGNAFDKLLRASEGLDAAARLARRHPRLPAGEDRERPERGDEAADGDRVAAAPPDVHRRPLRPELPPHARARLVVRVLVVVGLDHRHDDRAARLLPLEEVDLEL